MSELSLEDLALGERKFLHDMANHLVVAQGMSSFVMKAIKENRPLEEKDVERLQKTIDAIKKMTDQLKERRAVLHSVS
jgi:cob(I)alamin adenosyltransferase